MDEFLMTHIVGKSFSLAGSVLHAFEGALPVGYYHAFEGDGFVQVILAPKTLVEAFMHTLNGEIDLPENEKEFPGVEIAITTPVVGIFRKPTQGKKS